MLDKSEVGASLADKAKNENYRGEFHVGLMLFMGFMFVLLCLGVFFLLIGFIFLLLRHRGKKKGKPKKRHAVLAGVFLAIGAIVCALPVGYWLFLRSANSSMYEDYVDTGSMVEGGYQEETFTVDGVDYERLDVSVSALCPKGDAVFSWDAGTTWGCFFGYYNQGNYYAVKSTPGLDLVRDGGIHHRLWCRSDQLAQAQAWYGDDANYQWYLYDYHEGDKLYTFLSPQPDTAQISALLSFQSGNPEEVEFIVPNGTEIQKYSLCSISTDGVAERNWISLAVYDGQLCLAGTWNESSTDTTHTDTAYPIPADLANYFSNLLEENLQ